MVTTTLFSSIQTVQLCLVKFCPKRLSSFVQRFKGFDVNLEIDVRLEQKNRTDTERVSEYMCKVFLFYPSYFNDEKFAEFNDEKFAVVRKC